MMLNFLCAHPEIIETLLCAWHDSACWRHEDSQTRDNRNTMCCELPDERIQGLGNQLAIGNEPSLQGRVGEAGGVVLEKRK